MIRIDLHMHNWFSGDATISPKLIVEKLHPLSVESVVDFARERDGTIIIPHLYRELGLGDIARNIQADAVEVLNAYSTNKENKMAHELAKAEDLPGVAGSDAHTPKHMWAAYTEIKAEQNIDDILKAIRRGLVRVASEKPGEATI